MPAFVTRVRLSPCSSMHRASHAGRNRPTTGVPRRLWPTAVGPRTACAGKPECSDGTGLCCARELVDPPASGHAGGVAVLAADRAVWLPVSTSLTTAHLVIAARKGVLLAETAMDLCGGVPLLWGCQFIGLEW